jgi:hypothetical protein
MAERPRAKRLTSFSSCENERTVRMLEMTSSAIETALAEASEAAYNTCKPAVTENFVVIGSGWSKSVSIPKRHMMLWYRH